MANKYARIAQSLNNPPQSEVIPGCEADMGLNNAGGYTFSIDKWTMLDRFLITGSEGGTYYVGERKHTAQNFDNLAACVKEDGLRVVARIRELDNENRAPKMDPLIFALAYAQDNGDDATKTDAGFALGALLRTGTHFFMYMSILKALGASMSRSKRTALARALNARKLDELAFMVYKYANREGWVWRDLLRQAHIKPVGARGNFFKYLLTGKGTIGKLPLIVGIAEQAKDPDISDKKLAKLIREHNLPHEFIPSERQNGDVLTALAENMPATALIRQLARLTAAGIIKPLSDLTNSTVARLTDKEWLQKNRIHPVQLLSALYTYKSGNGNKGNLTWTPVGEISAALEEAYHLSFASVEPTGKRLMISIDASASMTWTGPAGLSGMDCREAASCLALTIAKTEKRHIINAFAGGMADFGVTSKDSIDSVLNKLLQVRAGRTDCAQPMLHAAKNKLGVDAFVILTDNETWFGDVHPVKALEAYRKQSGINAKLIVIGMTATNFSINDPKDPNGLDIAGFDAATPKLISEFIR